MIGKDLAMEELHTIQKRKYRYTKILTKDDIDELCEMYASGKYYIKEIADWLGVTKSAIIYWLKERGINTMPKIKKINLAYALCKNSNCLGFIIQYPNGKCIYQNDNDLGLDLDGINYLVEYKEKLFLYKRHYVYFLEENGDDDGKGVDLELAKALIKECHNDFIPLTPEEQKLCDDYWKSF